MSGAAETEKGTLGERRYAAPLGMGTSTTTGTTYMAVLRAAARKWRPSPRPRPASASIGARSTANGGNTELALRSPCGQLYVDRRGFGDDVPRERPGTAIQTDPLAQPAGYDHRPWRLSRPRRSPRPPMRSSSALFRRLVPRYSGAVDLGDDDPWICRAWLCRVPPELEGSGAGDLIPCSETYAKGRREAALSFCL